MAKQIMSWKEAEKALIDMGYKRPSTSDICLLMYEKEEEECYSYGEMQMRAWGA